MLYVTTRNTVETFTANHVLQQNGNAEDGLFVPMHFPKISEADQLKFFQMSFGQCTAELLNLFFSTKLTGWDVDFAIGRYPVRLQNLTNRIMMAEVWHNPQWQYQYLEKNLSMLLSAEAILPGNWISVAIEMAVLIGILGNCETMEKEPVDIAVVSGDFKIPISAWYLKKIGFPIGNIICCCNENNQFWELICNGQMRTDAAKYSTIVPEADVSLPIHLERLLSECGGPSEVALYLNCCQTRSVYFPSESVLQKLRQGLFVSVISSHRVKNTIPNAYNTHKYVLAPGSSLAYSGLLDYRAKTGISRRAIVLCENSPGCYSDIVAQALELSVSELKKII